MCLTPAPPLSGVTVPPGLYKAESHKNKRDTWALIYVSFSSVHISCGVARGPGAVALGSWASGTFLLLLRPQPAAVRSLALLTLRGPSSRFQIALWCAALRNEVCSCVSD